MIKVCYVIPTLGANIEWLEYCLESIASQHTVGIEVGIRIVAPQTWNAAEQVAHKFGAQLSDDAGDGLSRALNVGFKDISSYDYVGWLGDDDLLAPGSTQAVVEALSADSSTSFAYGRVRYLTASGESKWVLRPGSWAVPYARLGKNFIAQQGSLIRSTALAKAGKLDISLRNSMDQDLFLRLAQIGKPVYVARELGAWRIQPNSISSLKGSTDESRLVSDRYRPRHWSTISAMALPLISLSDRILLSAHSRVPHLRTPSLADGQPYYAPHKSALTRREFPS